MFRDTFNRTFKNMHTQLSFILTHAEYAKKLRTDTLAAISAHADFCDVDVYYNKRPEAVVVDATLYAATGRPLPRPAQRRGAAASPSPRSAPLRASRPSTPPRRRSTRASRSSISFFS